MLPTEINGHSKVDFHVFKKETLESGICQSINNPRMEFSVLYKSRNSKRQCLAVYFAALGSFAVDEVLLVII